MMEKRDENGAGAQAPIDRNITPGAGPLSAVKLLALPSLSVVGGILGVFDGVPWQIALPWLLLFNVVGYAALGLTTLYREWSNGQWVHKREYDELAETLKEVKLERDKERAEKEKLFPISMQNTQILTTLAEELKKRATQ